MHHLIWPNVGTMDTICETFVLAGVPLCVVFDSYKASTTKDSEQKHHGLEQISYPGVVIDADTPVPANKNAFLSNKCNRV